MKRVHVAYLELQPDFDRPSAPILLGAIGLSRQGPRDVSFSVAGRVAEPNHLPLELEGAGSLVVRIARNWPALIEDALRNLSIDEALEVLRSRFHLNLHFTEFQTRLLDPHAKLGPIVRKMFDERLSSGRPRGTREGTRPDVLDAWMIHASHAESVLHA